MIRLNVFIQVSAENRAAVLESAKELVAYSSMSKKTADNFRNMASPPSKQ